MSLLSILRRSVCLIVLSMMCQTPSISSVPTSAFVASRFPLLERGRLYPGPAKRAKSMNLRSRVCMRDRSIITGLSVGETVLVAKDVVTRGRNVKGMVGAVTAVWSKCEEDPICCCAENGMEEASIEVEFQLTKEEAEKFGDTIEGTAFSTYFATHELDVVSAANSTNQDSE